MRKDNLTQNALTQHGLQPLILQLDQNDFFKCIKNLFDVAKGIIFEAAKKNVE